MVEARYHSLLGSNAEQDLTISTTAISLTIPAELTTKLAHSGRAVIQCRTAAVIFQVSGQNPTAANRATGSNLPVDGVLTVYGIEMAQLRMIRASTTDGVVHVRYERKVA